MRLTRRSLLGAVGAALAAPALVPMARASVSRADLRFVFVRIFGGWDTTRAFAPEFDNENVAMEDYAAPAQAGNIAYVDAEERPGVREFFERYHSRLLVVNGLVVPSVNHRICLQLAMTGSNAESAADWPTLIATAQANRYGLPHVVAGGQPIPGDLGTNLVRVGSNGQIDSLLGGDIFAESDREVQAYPSEIEALIEAAVKREAEAMAGAATLSRQRHLREAYVSALTRSATMRSLRQNVRWATDGSFESQVDLATDLLSQGLSRCVTIAHESQDWDSHEANEGKQTTLFESLFQGLNYLMESLDATPGTIAPTAAEETVVVVMSEMGRTPQENSAKGKDHWAHTSAMLLGPGITTDRVVGDYDDLFYGYKLDLASGEIDTNGTELSPNVWGATLLELADIDPASVLPDGSAIRGILT